MLDSAAAAAREAQQRARAIHRLDEDQPQAQSRAGWVPGMRFAPSAGLWRAREARRHALRRAARLGSYAIPRVAGVVVFIEENALAMRLFIHPVPDSIAPGQLARIQSAHKLSSGSVSPRRLHCCQNAEACCRLSVKHGLERMRVPGETKGTRHPALTRPLPRGVIPTEAAGKSRRTKRGFRRAHRRQLRWWHRTSLD